MIYEIFNQNNYDLNIVLINKLVSNIIDKLKIVKPFNIIFVDEHYIQYLNSSYRKKDSITDVITFALNDNGESLLLGDVYVCYNVAVRQASDYGHSLDREIAFLVTHGILHLLGYDHKNEIDEKVMFKLQEMILNENNIER